MTLQARAERLADQTFLGGRPEVFEAMGRLQLITLLQCGLYPHSRVLDLGCGCLRGGYWILSFLEPDCYFGIEPNVDMLEVGRREIVGPELLESKRPRFLCNDQFDPSEFGVRFDFIMARSIWTHASRQQIAQMLDAFVTYGAEDAVFLTSFLPAARGHEDQHADWIGRSHKTDQPGTRRHDRDWIERECRQRKIELRELSSPLERQKWLLLAKGEGGRPAQTYLERLATPSGGPAALIQALRRSIGRMFARFAGRRR